MIQIVQLVCRDMNLADSEPLCNVLIFISMWKSQYDNR